MIAAFVAAMAGAIIAAGPTSPTPTPTPASPAAREAFDRGRTAFGRAEYQRAIEILRPLLYPDVALDSEGEIVQAHRMLGVAYLFENKPDEARREFEKLLRLRPDYRFDPLLDPQRVVDFFNGVLKEEKEMIDSMNQRRLQREKQAADKRDREAARLRLPPAVVRYERHSYAVNFVPFGAGQFQNGHRRKGWFFFGAEAVLGAASLGAFATNLGLYGLAPNRKCNIETMSECPQQSIDHSEENTSRWLTGVQVVSGGVFFAVAIWGVIDAIVNYQPEVQVPESTPGKVARAPAPGVRFSLSPGGFGAAWQF
jgi:tetratricopeptide (TPR) repeat protein